MKPTLNYKQLSILTYFCDAVELVAKTDPKKINKIVNLTLSSNQNTNDEFYHIVESFMDCNAEQMRDKCEKLRERIT